MGKRTTKIKLCGMRTVEDIEAVNSCRPDFAGIICTEGFRRYIPWQEALELKERLDPSIACVGVFVNETYEYIETYLKRGIIDVVQLHGREDNYYIEQLRRVMMYQGTVAPVIKAFAVRSREDIEEASRSTADYILLDNGTGSGESFDWSLLEDVNRKYFLAGGLGPDNVAAAVEQLQPFAVDMSSRIETDFKKDPVKMHQAVEAVRNLQKTGACIGQTETGALCFS
jgi:phosphoribosylanthranilate isomerase